MSKQLKVTQAESTEIYQIEEGKPLNLQLEANTNYTLVDESGNELELLIQSAENQNIILVDSTNTPVAILENPNNLVLNTVGNEISTAKEIIPTGGLSSSTLLYTTLSALALTSAGVAISNKDGNKANTTPAAENEILDNPEKSVAEQQEQLPVEQAEQEQISAEQNEQEQIATEQVEPKQAATEQTEQAQSPAEQIKQEQTTAEQVEQEQTSAEQNEQEQSSAEQIEQEQDSAEQNKQEQAATEQVEQEQDSAEQNEQNQATSEQIEQEQDSAEQNEQEQTSTEQVELEQSSAEQVEQEQDSAEQNEQEQVAAEQIEQEQNSAEQTEQEQATAEQNEQEQSPAEQIEQENEETEKPNSIEQVNDEPQPLIEFVFEETWQGYKVYTLNWNNLIDLTGATVRTYSTGSDGGTLQPTGDGNFFYHSSNTELNFSPEKYVELKLPNENGDLFQMTLPRVQFISGYGIGIFAISSTSEQEIQDYFDASNANKIADEQNLDNLLDSSLLSELPNDEVINNDDEKFSYQNGSVAATPIELDNAQLQHIIA